MRIVGVILKNELLKTVKNKKMLASMFAMPLLVIAVLLFMNVLQQDAGKTAKECRVYLLGLPVQETELVQDGFTLHVIPDEAADYESFCEKRIPAAGDIVVAADKESIKLYYCSTDSMAKSLLPVIKSSLLAPYMRASFLTAHGISLPDVCVELKDTSSELAKQNRTLSFMLPYLLMLVLFMNLNSVVADSIAGEKERGTLGKLLLAPVKRSQLLIGKMLGGTVIGAVASAVYFFILAAASVLTERMAGQDLLGMNGASMSIGQISTILFGFVFLALVFVAGIMLLSGFARTLKEATNLSMIIYFLVIAAAIAAVFSKGEPPVTAYLIPVYNFSLLMQKVLVGTAQPYQGVVTVLSLLVTFAVLAALAVASFGREKTVC